MKRSVSRTTVRDIIAAKRNKKAAVCQTSPQHSERGEQYVDQRYPPKRR